MIFNRVLWITPQKTPSKSQRFIPINEDPPGGKNRLFTLIQCFNEEITVCDKEYELIGLVRHLGAHFVCTVCNSTAYSEKILIPKMICEITRLDLSR